MSILRFPFITSSPSPAHGGSVHYLAAVLSLYWCIWGRAHEGKEEDSSRDNRPLRIVDKIYRRRERDREEMRPCHLRLAFFCALLSFPRSWGLYKFVTIDTSHYRNYDTRETVICRRILRKGANSSFIRLNLSFSRYNTCHSFELLLATRMKNFRELIFFTRRIIFLFRCEYSKKIIEH